MPESAQQRYSRQLNENQNARLAKKDAAFRAQEKQMVKQATQIKSSAGLALTTDFVIIGAIILGAGILSSRKRRSAPQKPTEIPAAFETSTGTSPNYKAAHSLLTATEARFYESLYIAVGPVAAIQCKVRLADILLSERGDLAAFRKVSQKHVDFLLCHQTTLKPILAIELDDRSHDRPDRIARDQFVDAAYKSAGIRVLHIPVQSEYHTGSLLAALQPYLTGTMPTQRVSVYENPTGADPNGETQEQRPTD